jgi:hypothetical protein
MTVPDDFPGEDEWLLLPPPGIRPGFVDATLARVLADAAERAVGDPEAAGTDAPELPAGLLAAYAVPGPSRGLVDRIAGAVQRDRAESWRELLLQYETPEPSPEFVARTVRALRSGAPARSPLPFLRRTAMVTALAAAALIVVAVLWPQPPRGPQSLQAAALQEVPAASAAAYSPTPIAALVRASRTRRAGLDAQALPAVPADGLVLVAGGSR